MWVGMDLVCVKGTELWHCSDLGQSCTLSFCGVPCTCFQVAKTTNVGIGMGPNSQ